MTEGRLTSLPILEIHTARTLNVNAVMDEFASSDTHTMRMTVVSYRVRDVSGQHSLKKGLAT